MLVASLEITSRLWLIERLAMELPEALEMLRMLARGVDLTRGNSSPPTAAITGSAWGAHLMSPSLSLNESRPLKL